MLQKQGHQVKTVENGRQAVEIYKKEKFDLIVTDIQMPEMDGLKAISIIRSLAKEGERHVPIIVITGCNGEQVCRETGANAYLAKPFDYAVLCRTIEAAVAS
jgi:CheY-like chemotaxis protein